MPNQHARPLTRILPDAGLPFSLDSLWFSAVPARQAAQVVEVREFREMAQGVGMTIAKSGLRQGGREAERQECKGEVRCGMLNTGTIQATNGTWA